MTPLPTLIARQGGICFYCILPMHEPTRDHVIPRSSKTHAPHVTNPTRNHVAACVTCNLRKANRLPTDLELERLLTLKAELTSEAEPGDWRKVK